MKKGRLTKNAVVGIACIIISGFFIWASTGIKVSLNPGDPGAKLFPLIGCGLLLFGGIGMLLRRPDADSDEAGEFMTGEQWKRAIVLFLMYILYFLLLWLLGFTVAVPVMLFILCILFTSGDYKSDSRLKIVLRALIYAACVGALIYVLYVVALDSALPRGRLWTWLGF